MRYLGRTGTVAPRSSGLNLILNFVDSVLYALVILRDPLTLLLIS